MVVYLSCQHYVLRAHPREWKKGGTMDQQKSCSGIGSQSLHGYAFDLHLS